MKALDPELLKILACPVCKTQVGAVVGADPERPAAPTGAAFLNKQGGPVLPLGGTTEVLVCEKCSRRYPVVDGIPDMIPGPKP